jgi:hypothetical protein
MNPAGMGNCPGLDFFRRAVKLQRKLHRFFRDIGRRSLGFLPMVERRASGVTAHTPFRGGLRGIPSARSSTNGCAGKLRD